MIDIRNNFFLVAFLCIISTLVTAQLPISFSQNFGDNQKNIIQDVIDLDGQACLTIGYTKDEQSRDVNFWVNRFDNDGTLIWTKDFGGSGFENATSAALLEDGNIVIAGYGSFSDSDSGGASKRADGAIIKIDADGNIIWERVYGGLGQDQFLDVLALPNGECLAVGSTSSYVNNFDERATNGWAVRVNSNGGVVWNRQFGGSRMDAYNSAILNDDGSFILGGSTHSSDGDLTNSFGDSDLWLSRITSAGEHDWSRNYGGNNYDILDAIAPTVDGGYVLASTSYSDMPGQLGHGDVWVLKVSALGNQVWSQRLGGTATDKSTDIKPFQGDGFLISATTMSDDEDISVALGGLDAWIAKLNSNGNIEWKENLGGTKNDAINSLAIADDGTVWLAGYSFSTDIDLPANLGVQDAWLIRTNSENPPIVRLGGTADYCAGAEITLDATDPNCSGCTYLWNDGATSPIRTITIASSIIYSVTLTDIAGGMSSDDLTINIVDPIEATADILPVDCNDASTGEISLSVNGGANDYDFQWSNTAINNAINDNLSADTYFVTISDEALCEFTDSYALDNPPAIVVEETIVLPSCSSSNQGAISLSISGGEPPYQITWSNGFIGPALTGLDPGEYTATITDARNCEIIESYFVSNDVAINITDDVQNVSCFGKSDGSIALIVSGDFPPFTFSWDNGFSTSSIFGLNEGDYTITITDAMGCQLIAGYTVFEPNELEVIEEQTNTQVGQSNGRLLLNIIGGTPSYNVIWSNGETGVLLDNLDIGVYSATITDANDCELIVTYEIEPSVATSQLNIQALQIYPNPNNGIFTIDLPEEVSGKYTINLRNIDGKSIDHNASSLSSHQLSIDATQAVSGLYILTIQNADAVYQTKLIIHP